MSDFAAILRTPRVAVLLVAAMLVRLSPAINNLAILLLVASETGSFAAAGIAAGAFTLGTACGAPPIARICDRRGIGLLAPIAIVHAAALTTLFALALANGPTALLVVAALTAGVSYPPTGAALRSRWAALLSGTDLLGSAYALDSVAASISFIAGPLVTGVLVATTGPGVALPLAGAIVLGATAVFVAVVPGRHDHRGTERTSGPLGALASRGIRTLVLAALAAGFCMGTVEVSLAAFSKAEGRAALAGVLLALWSVSSALASVAYGLRAKTAPHVRVYLWSAALLPVASLPIALGGSPVTMAALVLLAGIPYAPFIATANQLVGEVSPSDARTEAYTWLITSLVAGSSTGAAISGTIVDALDWQLAVIAGAAVGACGAAALRFRRGSLTVPVAAAEPVA